MPLSRCRPLLFVALTGMLACHSPGLVAQQNPGKAPPMDYLQEITVGPAEADVTGTDNRAIQIAVDAVAMRGGGTVRVLPGTYTCHDAVRLHSGVRLVGDRDRTVLKLAPIVTAKLAADADIGQKQISPVDAVAFRVGMGVVLRDANKPNEMACMPLTVTRIENGVLHTGGWIEHDYIATNGATVVTYFPLIHGWEIEDAVIDGFTVDAKPDKMDGLEGTRSGAVHLSRAKDCAIRNVKALNCLGDGISFWQSDRVTVENCETARNTEYGIHPGSHAPHAVVRGCDIHDNGSDGLYLCWGVHHGLFEKNVIHGNGGIRHRSGISIGHKDTDNLFVGNHVYGNHKHGVCFRTKTEANGPHRNTFRENVIENNGCPEEEVPERLRADPRREVLCCGVLIRGVTHDLLFEKNVIRETREGGKRRQHNAFYIDKNVRRVRLVDNEISEHPGEKVVDESGSGDHHLQGLTADE